MADYPPSFQDLIDALRQLPSVGARSAERLALFLAGPKARKAGVASRIAQALLAAGERLVPCPQCGFYAEKEDGPGLLCPICRDPSRDAALWCLVEQPNDVVKFEKAADAGFRGLYHVLGGKLSPLEGIGPEELSVAPLLARVAQGAPREVILALGTDVEGETTALYLVPLLKERGVRVSRLATGLPAGGGLEFADSVTLGYALAGRHQVCYIWLMETIPPPLPPETPPAKRLRKSRDKKLCGVCGGIAEYFGVDPTPVRLVWALATVFTIFAGVIVYIVFALVLPEPAQA